MAAARKVLSVRTALAKSADPKQPGPVDWAAVAARLADLPTAAQDTEAELMAARGEGPGVDDLPALECGPEKMARMKRYANDVQATRRIRFVPRDTVLSGPGGRPVGEMVRG